MKPYQYDAEGERTSVTAAKGKTTDYSYDQAGSLAGFENRGVTSATYVTTVTDSECPNRLMVVQQCSSPGIPRHRPHCS